MVPLWLMKLVPIALVAVGTLVLATSKEEDDNAKDGKRGNRRDNRDPDRRERPRSGRDHGTGSVDDARVEPSNVGAGNRRVTGDDNGGQHDTASAKRGKAKPVKGKAKAKPDKDGANEVDNAEPSPPSGDDDGGDVRGEPNQDAGSGDQEPSQ